MGLLLIAAIWISFFYNIRAIPLFDVDEGAFSEATREMFLRDDFISPYLLGEPRYDKPILAYWLQAASVSLVGMNELGFRLPSALASTAWTLILLWFVRRQFGIRQGLTAALVMATSLEVTIMGNAATADALLNLWLTAALLSLYLYLQEQEPLFLYLTAAFASLGFLTKGPIALVIPALVSLIYCLSRGVPGRWFKMIADPWAWLLFLGVGLPWYLLQYAREGEAFLQGFFLEHNVGRFGGAMEGHTGTLFYYVPIVLLGVLPYTTVLLNVLRSTPQLWKTPLGRYLLLWFGFVFLFFSVSATKLPHYVVYGYSALFILVAYNIERPRSIFAALLPQLLVLIFLLLLPSLVKQILPSTEDQYIRAQLLALATQVPLSYYITLSMGLVVTLLFILERRLRLSYKLVLSGLLLSYIAASQLLPMVARVQQLPVIEAAHVAAQHTQPVVIWGLDRPSFAIYSGKTIRSGVPRPGELVLTKEKYLDRLDYYQILYRKYGIVLVLNRENKTDSAPSS